MNAENMGIKLKGFRIIIVEDNIFGKGCHLFKNLD